MRRVWWMAMAMLSAVLPASAARWTLVDFGTNGVTTQMPYPEWTALLRHPTYTEYVKPDGDSNHWGIVEVDGVPDGEFAYFGVSGTTPIHFGKGHKIVSTFFNRSYGEEYLMARVSLMDLNSPDTSETNNHWFTMAGPTYTPVDSPPTVTPVDGRSLYEMVFYITGTNSTPTRGVPSSEGDFTAVNISKPDNNPWLVLTKVELSDEADFTPPGPPQDLLAGLTSTTDGCGSNAVKLTWSPAVDPGPHAEGVARYLVYRDGELYDVVSPDMTAHMGTNPYYIDINVAPETRYAYYVTAMDRAPVGQYPTLAHPDSRRGNESGQSATVSIVTPTWSSALLVNPHVHCQYLGAFRLPYNDAEPWAYASAGLTYCPPGNPGYNPTDQWPGSLYALTRLGDEVAELTIPIPVLSTNVNHLPMAVELKGPTNIWPAVYGGETIPDGGGWRAAGIEWHPASNGVAAQVYYGVCNSYGTDQTAPAHGAFDPALTSATGAWHVGAPPPDNVFPGLVSQIMFTAPADWAAEHAGGRSLIVGNTYVSGAGVPSHGPSLYAIAPWETGALPTNGAALSTVALVRYSAGATLTNRNINWSQDQYGEGGAWLTVSNKSGVAISRRRTVGDIWYGDAGGGTHYEFNIPEPPLGDHGAAATDFKTGLMLYNPADLAAVAAGAKEGWEPLPYVVFDFGPFSMMAGGGDGQSGAIAFDSTRGRLFFIERNGDPGYEYGHGLVHAWQLAQPLYSPTLTIDREGAGLRLNWFTQADGSRHQVQRSTNLISSSNWQNVAAPLDADGAAKTHGPLAASGGTNALFYRLRVTR